MGISANFRARNPRVGKPAHNAKPVEAEYGWLTPIRKSVGDPRLWFFRCRCGKEVLRELGNARWGVANGATPKCDRKCTYVG